MGRPIDPPPEHTSPIEASASASAQTDAHLFDRDSAAGWSQQRSSDQMDAYLSPSNRPQAGLPLSQSLAESGGRMSPSDSTTVAGHSSRGVNAALLAHQQEERGVSQLQNAVAAQGDGQGRALAMSPMPEASNPTAGTAESQQGGLTDRRGPVEFNHAISYVNKIKVSQLHPHPLTHNSKKPVVESFLLPTGNLQAVLGDFTDLPTRIQANSRRIRASDTPLQRCSGLAGRFQAISARICGACKGCRCATRGGGCDHAEQCS